VTKRFETFILTETSLGTRLTWPRLWVPSGGAVVSAGIQLAEMTHDARKIAISNQAIQWDRAERHVTLRGRASSIKPALAVSTR